MRICFVISSLAIGGAEAVTINLVNELAKNKKFYIELICLKKSQDLLSKVSADVHVKFLGAGKNFFSLPRLFITLLKSKFNLVFGVTDTCGILCGICSLFTNFYFVPVSHSGFGKSFKGKYFVWIVNYLLISLLYFRAYRWLVISEGVKSSYSSLFPSLRDKLQVVGNAAYSISEFKSDSGIDETNGNLFYRDLLNNKNKTRKNIVAVGRLVRVKGFDLLIEAIALLVKKNHPVYLYLIGDGVEIERLKKLADNLGVLANVNFVGAIKHPKFFLREADLYVHPSRSDGLPTTLIEALACGLPCVSYDCDYGPREIIENSFNGILVNPVGCPNSLASHIENLLSDQVLMNNISLNSAGSVYKYSAESISDLYHNLILSSSQGRTSV